MSEEKRTPTAWTTNCLKFLQEINPAYRKNREAKGRFIEFIREDDSGLSISHNFLKIRDCYYYSFALLFTIRRTTMLTHSLLAGSRFDHNRTISTQFYNDVGLFRDNPGFPQGVWSFGSWRKNTMENLRQGLRVPEEYLLPFYRQQLRTGKNALVALFEKAQTMVDSLPSEISTEEALGILDPAGNLIEPYKRECYCLDALKIARGGCCKYGYGPPEPCFVVENIPAKVIVLSQLSLFIEVRDLLPKVVEIARRI